MDFLLGAMAGSSLLSGMYLLMSTRNKTNLEQEKVEFPQAKHPHMQEVFRFFADTQTGKVDVKYGGICDCVIRNKQVNTYLNTYSDGYLVTILDVSMYVKSDRLFSIQYEVENQRFRKLKDEERILGVAEIDTFTELFQVFVEQYVGLTKQQDIVAVMNERMAEKETKKESENHSNVEHIEHHFDIWLSQITNTTIQTFARDLNAQLQVVHSEQQHLDTEELHRLERVEQVILPELLMTFCQLDEQTQQKQTEVLLTALSEVKEKVEELEQKAHQKKAFAFEKNIELLKNF